MDMKKVEKEMARTHHLFRRNKAASQKAKNLASFARTLDPSALAIMTINLIANLAPIMTKAKLAQRLRESCEPCESSEMWADHIEPLLTEIYADIPQQNLKLSDLLEDVRAISNGGGKSHG